MHTCFRCDTHFPTTRGLAMHQKRTHVVSDDWVNDFLNLAIDQQAKIMGDCDCDLQEIVIGPIDDDRVNMLKVAITQATGVPYRYVIQELP